MREGAREERGTKPVLGAAWLARVWQNGCYGASKNKTENCSTVQLLTCPGDLFICVHLLVCSGGLLICLRLRRVLNAGLLALTDY